MNHSELANIIRIIFKFSKKLLFLPITVIFLIVPCSFKYVFKKMPFRIFTFLLQNSAQCSDKNVAHL
ncbi:hypothetical protein CRM94_22240 [Burkholderia gladioli]|uniref:Uncharacterized protein n=1 Tax=Burkholderia gladioli TaxID=28095 RepID=A0A2A7S0U2_BURGA|nr:hypothetical protein CRM94_22240 [Burkholderia gladioli]